MLNKLGKIINHVSLKLLTSLRRFPEALVLAFAIVIIFIYMNHIRQGNDVLTHVALVLALGIPLSLCIRMFWEKIAFNKVTAGFIYGFAVLALTAYYKFLLPDLEMVSVTRYIGLSLALYLLFMGIPYLERRDGFELYVIKLFTGFFVTYFYSLILFLGLAAILFTINTLFSVGISGKVYFDLWLIVAGIFAPAYFLAGLPAYGAVYKCEDYPKFLRVLFLYIVMPLLAVYTAILYVYFIKIIVTGFWPAGIVSHLVLWYSIISTVVIFFVYLLKEKNLWAQTFITFLPKLILPLLLMMFVAMGIRINAYGVTEKRYLVMAGGFWSSGCMLYFALKNTTQNIKIVLSAAIIAALAVSGPWSAYGVSKYSQNNQLEKILTGNKMLVNGKITPSREISAADKKSISSIINYFNRYHELKDLKLLPADFSLEGMQDVFGFTLVPEGPGRFFSHYLREQQELIDIRGFDYFLNYSALLKDEPVMIRDSWNISYLHDSNTLIIKKAGQVVYERNLAEVALDIHNANRGNNALEDSKMTFADKNAHVRIMIRFRNINGTEDSGGGAPRIDWLDFSVLLKLAEQL
ncbi:MAG: DUF4153 domain-containing protein [Peptococcaceae bacterium]